MDEVRLVSKGDDGIIKTIIGKKVTKYLKKKGVDVLINVNNVAGEMSPDTDGNVTVRADLDVVISKAQLIKLLM